MEGAAQRLSQVMQRLRRLKAKAGNRIAREDVKRFAQHDATRTRRRGRNDMIAAIVALNWRTLYRAVGSKIGHRHDPAVRLASGNDTPCRFALVKSVRAIGGNRLQNIGQVGLNQPFAALPGLSLIEEDSGAWLILGKILCTFGKEFSIALIKDEATARQPDRRRHQRHPRLRAIFRSRELKSCNSARNAHRAVATRRKPGDDIALGVLVHCRSRRLWRHLAKIDERLASIIQTDCHKAAAANIASFGKCDGKCISDRDGCIDRVATAFEHIHPYVAGEPVCGNHHAMFGPNRHRRGGLGLLGR